MPFVLMNSEELLGKETLFVVVVVVCFVLFSSSFWAALVACGGS